MKDFILKLQYLYLIMQWVLFMVHGISESVVQDSNITL